MPKTLDEIVADRLGALQLANCRLEAEIEALKAKLSEQPPPTPVA